MPSGTFTDVKSLNAGGIHTFCADKSGKRKEILCCGEDGTISIWDNHTLTSSDPAVRKNVAEATHHSISWIDDVIYIAYTASHLLTGIETKVVGKASWDTLEKPVQVLQFSLEPSAMDYSPNYLVVGCADFTVKIMNTSGDETFTRIECAGPVLHIAIDPTEEFFAVTTEDGTLSIRRLKEPATVILNTSIWSDEKEASESRGVVTWSKDGEYLYYPGEGSIKMILKQNWKLEKDGFSAPDSDWDFFSCTCLSACGNFLAASTTSNKIFVWDIKERKLIANDTYKRVSSQPYKITSIIFCPFDDKALTIADSTGYVCKWTFSNSKGKPAKTTFTEVDDEEDLPSERGASSFDNDDDNVPKKKSRIVVSDDDDYSRDASDNKKREKERPKKKFAVEEADDDGADKDDDNDDNMSEDGINFIASDGEVDEDTKMSNDIGAIKRKFGFDEEKTGTLEDFGFGEAFEQNAAEKPKEVVRQPEVVTNVVEYDPPAIPSHFVSGSSPYHLSDRYLKWNAFGVVRSFTVQDGKSIEIQFHDSSIHSDIVLDNLDTNYSMADISDKAVALASAPEGKNAESSVFVIHIGAWDSSSRRWETKLPAKDVAIDILVSDEIIAVLTVQRNIRIFTLAGTQRQVITHPGPILTAALHGSELTIASVTGGEYYEDINNRKSKAQYQYSTTTYNMHVKSWYSAGSSISTTNLPVTPGRKPLWLAYSSGGNLVTMDNEYDIRIRTPAGMWLPIFDGSKELVNSTDGVWPISVVEHTKQFRFVYCKGSRHPAVSLKIAPTISPWTVPLGQKEGEKGQLEENLILNELQQALSVTKNVDQSSLLLFHAQELIKLFAMACKAERDVRASEFVAMTSSSKAVQMMCNYATSLKKPVLAEKVASFGREHVASGTMGSSDNLQPRRVAPKRKSDYPAAQKLVERLPEPEDDDDEPQEHNESSLTLRDADQSQLDMSLPIRSRNPFKKEESVLDTSSGSVFDKLEMSFDNPRKRKPEESQKVVGSAKKQSKLCFTQSSQPGKENASVSAYSVWLEENESNMRSMFSGDLMDFDKFCVSQFKLLPAAKKKDFRERANAC